MTAVMTFYHAAIAIGDIKRSFGFHHNMLRLNAGEKPSTKTRYNAGMCVKRQLFISLSPKLGAR